MNNQGYIQELNALHHRRVYLIIAFGLGLFVSYAILEYLVVPEFFTVLLFYRLVALAIGIVLVVANALDRQGRRALFIGFTAYVGIGLITLNMLFFYQELAVPYYVGLLVAIGLYIGFAPLTLAQALGSGFLLVFAYVACLLLQVPPPLTSVVFPYSKVFFMVCFVLVVSVKSRLDTSLRRQEFSLRSKVQEGTDRVERHAQHLEAEVKRRSEEKEVADRQYQLLFDQLADDVVVIDSQGKILQANASFIRHFGSTAAEESWVVYDLLDEDKRKVLQEELEQVLVSGNPAIAIPVFLRARNGKLIDAEVSGTLLRRRNALLGIQLVIRDIGVRRVLEQQLVASLETVKQTEIATILALARLSEFRVVTPGRHLERIRAYCKELARYLQFHQSTAAVVDEAYIEDIYHGAILHDIGKVAIPDHILEKSGELSDKERDVMRQHTRIGGNVIRDMGKDSPTSGFLAVAAEIAYFHHERWDGTGYPYGLSGLDIPLSARIMAVADHYEELTTGVADKVRIPHDEAVRIVAGNSGTGFDPLIVEAFEASEAEFLRISNRLRNDEMGELYMGATRPL
ncbi:MAG: hypothetical protein CSA34_01620 [Desulfobulbus propionicus]|nr:MAG: hypothetical protein CSA34_01620 [Desulfobulbus propionicus]